MEQVYDASSANSTVLRYKNRVTFYLPASFLLQWNELRETIAGVLQGTSRLPGMEQETYSSERKGCREMV